MNKIYCKMKEYIQPFEKKLALRELEYLSGDRPVQLEDAHLTYSVNTTQPCGVLAERLTYWEYVCNGAAKKIIPLQIKREASFVNGNGNYKNSQQVNLFRESEGIFLPVRRILRYGPHNLHEYRGKFFPQLVKALLNSCNAGRNTIVMDNMCGSGTVLVEACLMGCSSYGIDMNPLSVLITRAKCASLFVNSKALRGALENIRKKVKNAQTENLWAGKLPDNSRKYLNEWFSRDTFADLCRITNFIQNIFDVQIKDIFTCVLSNIIRRVSFQKNDDLRVRRDTTYASKLNVYDIFFQECEKMVTNIGAFLDVDDGDRTLGKYGISEGDGKRVADHFPKILGKVDLIITSPPYATALPYLDTDRLSLYFLNLMPRNEHRRKDKGMIGNREISNGERERLWLNYEYRKKELPQAITKTIDRIHRLNISSPAGFRRMNLPALLSKYFFDMQDVFRGYRKILKQEGKAFVVVGNNHTIAGGKKVTIQTDTLLAELAEREGLKLKGSIPMEMLISRDIFKKNASSGETIIELSNPQ